MLSQCPEYKKRGNGRIIDECNEKDQMNNVLFLFKLFVNLLNI